MRRFSFPIGVALVLASTLALAAPQQKVGVFAPIAASGVSGDARALETKADTRVQGHIDNLTPGAVYEVVISSTSDCTGTGQDRVLTVTANGSGKINFNELLVNRDINTVNSIQVRVPLPVGTPLACTGQLIQ